MDKKYDLRAIPYIGQKEPFLAKTSNNIILRRDENGDFILLDPTQEIMLSLTKQDAKELAASILNSTVNNIYPKGIDACKLPKPTIGELTFACHA